MAAHATYAPEGSHVVVTATVQGKDRFHSRFTEEESGAQQGEGTCPRPHEGEQQGPSPGSASPHCDRPAENPDA